MRIKRIFNNNIVMAVDDLDGHEIIALGKGIGFRKKIGGLLESDKIEQRFALQKNPAVDRLFSLLNENSPVFLELAVEIVKKAEQELNLKFRKTIYLTLMDHLSFAVSRMAEDKQYESSFFPEVSRLYHQEYEIGKWSLDHIKEKIGVVLPIQEASNIALHLINAQIESSGEMSQTMKMTKQLKDILNIVKYTFNRPIDENTLSYDRFLIHLRFFLQHLQNYSEKEDDKISVSENLVNEIKSKYPKSYQCSDKIIKYLKTFSPVKIADEEKVFLAIHIHRVTSR